MRKKAGGKAPVAKSDALFSVRDLGCTNAVNVCSCPPYVMGVPLSLDFDSN